MADPQVMVPLAQIRISGAGEYVSLLSMQIDTNANAHGVMIITLCLDSDVEGFDKKDWMGEQISAQINDKQVLFCGECVYFYKNVLAQYCEVTLYVVSQTYQADIVKNSRTFQNATKTFKEVAENVFEPYGARIEVDNDKKIPMLLVQDKETDWDFIVRVANQLGYQVYPDVSCEGIRITFGNSGKVVPNFWDNSVYLSETINPQELRMRAANQSEEAGMYHYAQTEVCSFNPCGMAGTFVDGRIVTSSQIESQKGVLINRATTSYPEDALASSESMMADSYASHILMGTVLDVNESTIKVQFDVDENQSVAEARELPYENTINNFFYCMPQSQDKVFGYIDNRGTAVILGCKRKDTEDRFYDKPEEKALTVLDNMIHFKQNEFVFSANREASEKDVTKSVTIRLNKEDGIDIHSQGCVYLNSMQKVGIRAGGKEFDIEETLKKYAEAKKVGEDKYIADGGSESTRDSWLEEGLKVAGESFVNMGKALIMYDVFRDIARRCSEPEYETESESFSTGTIYMWAETIILKVGDSYIILGNDFGFGTSNIYINAVLFEWLGFEKKSGYEKVEETYSDGWEFALDIISVALDIGAAVAMCFPGVGTAIGIGLMAVNVGISLGRGDVCGGLLGCIPLVSEIKTVAKFLKNSEKVANALKVFGIYCKSVNSASQVYFLGTSIYDGNFKWEDTTMIALNVASIITDIVTDKVRTRNEAARSTNTVTASETSGSVVEMTTISGVDAPDRVIVQAPDDVDIPKDVDTARNADAGASNAINGEGMTTMPVDVPSDLDAPPNTGSNAPEADATTTSTQDVDTTTTGVEADLTPEIVEGADPVNMATGALTEKHTDLRIKDIRGDYAVVRTYKSIYENRGRILGSRWIFQFETSLYRKDKYISVYLPDAHKEQFTLTEKGWVNQIPGKEKYSLIETADGYRLEEKETLCTYRFNKVGQILNISDSYGNKTRYSYIGKFISKITLESGMELILNYEDNKLSLLRDSQGREWHYRYEGELLTAVTYPNGGTIRYEYTKEGYITRIFNENGKCYVTNQFDRKGRVVRQQTADGEEYVFFYNDEKKENTLTTLGLNRSITYCYNRHQLIEKIIFDDGTTEEKKYDANEKVIWEKDRLGREIQREFNAEGKLLKATEPNGLCTIYTYNENGNCLTQEDNAGRKIKYEYDEQGGLSAASFMTEDGVYLTTRYERDGHGRIIRQKYADGSEKSWEYGRPFSQPTSFMGAEGENFTYELDDYGRKMIFHGARGDVYYGYNANHFVTTVRDEENNCTRYQYDLTGNKTGILFPEDVLADDGKGITYDYDLMDHLIGMENACGEGYLREVNSEGKTLSLQNKAENAYATKYSYDADGRRTHVYYPDGGVQRNFYDACGNLIKQVAPEDYEEKTDNGDGMTFAYDAMNRLTGVWDRDGRQIRALTYDLAGRIVKDSRGKQLETRDVDGEVVGTLYCYNHAGWLLEKRVPVSVGGGETLYRLTIYGYDKRGRRTTEKRYLDYQKKDSMGGRVLLVQRQFDRSGRLIKVTDSMGSRIEYHYDAHNKMTFERRKIREGVYQEKSYTYTKAGNLQSIESSADGKGSGRLTARTSFRYNRNGKVTAIVSPSGNEICFTYDRSNRIIKEEYRQKDGKLYSVTEYFRDGEGRVNRVVTDGRNTEYGYDLRGRRNKVCEAGVPFALIYDKNGRVIREIDAAQYRKDGFEGKGRSYRYEKGRLMSVCRKDGSPERQYTYNAYGEVVGLTEGTGAQISLSYDLAGRRTHAITGSGSAQSWSYDAWGNVCEVTDGNGNRTGFAHDGWGKVIRIDRADGGVEHYTYDEAGNLTETQDGNGGRIRFLYNSQNRLEQRIDQAGESEYWNYDAEGRCCLYKNRNGQEIAYSYNMLGSLLSRRSVKEQSLMESYGYTPEGRLAYAIGGGMRYDYVYDEFGRLSEKKASGRTLLSYTYDEDGRLSSRRDISGKETDYRYDENGLLGSILDNGMEVAAYNYTLDGRIAEVISGPLRSSYEYTPEGSLSSLNTLMGEEPLVSNRYAYDPNGNCIRKETLAGVTEYGYDVMNRLSEQSGPFGRECYTYDYADNRTCREWFAAVDREIQPEYMDTTVPDMEMPVADTPLGSERYEYDERNRLVRSILSEGNGGEDIIREYTYDNQGNLLSDGQATYIYDTFNRMEKAELKDGRTQVNRYDAEGLRHEMEENGQLVQFLYSGRNVVAETESDGNIIRYIRGLGLVSSDSEKAKSYYHYACDELGSITDIVKGAVKKKLSEEKHSEEEKATETAQVLNHYEYDAFGNTVVCEETVTNRFRFAGEQYDTVTGQYYLRARFYNPVIGRFLQEDDYYGDGLNLYAYCRNNPVMYVDPSGHNKESAANKYEVQNAEALRELVEEMNQTTGATADDIETIRQLAEEFGMNPDELNIRTVDEVNGEALRELATEATPGDLRVLMEWANEYDVPIESLLPTNPYELTRANGVTQTLSDAEIDACNQYNLQMMAESGSNTAKLRDTKNIRYSQDNIRGTFDDGTNVNELVYHLKNSPEYASMIEPIRLVKYNDLPSEVQQYLGKQGVSSSAVFTLDNRRLYAAKQAGVKVNSVWATQADLEGIDLIRRFTTETAGKTIEIR